MKNIEKVVLDKIDEMRDEIIKFHQHIIQMPSENPPAKYKEISKFLEMEMNKVGLNTKNKRNNVIGELGGDNGPRLIFNAHFDTVEAFRGWKRDPFGGIIENNRIYGRGASDDKSCVVSEIFAAKALIDAGVNFNGKLILTAVVDEELGGLRGTQYLLDNDIINGDACIVGDAPANYPTAYIGGAIFISFMIEGKQSHGFAFPDISPPYRNKYSGVSAIHKMIKIMNFLLALQEEFIKTETKYPTHPDLPSKISNINIAMIEGGTKISTVANKCFIHCSIQTIPEHNVEEIKSKILKFVEDMKKSNTDLNITVQIPIFYESQKMDIDSDFAQIVKNATNAVYGEEREFTLFNCTTDAHFFMEKGIETFLIGTFRGDNAIHSADENVIIDDLINTTKMFAVIALNYLK
jgi:succinyl-diaminopimelate desuccinylase